MYCMDKLLNLIKPHSKLIRINQPKKGNDPWIPADCKLLISLAITNHSVQISTEDAERLGRTKLASNKKLKSLKAEALNLIQNNNFQSKSPFWTKEKCVQLLKLCKEFTFSWAQIAEKIGQTERSCKHKAQKLYMRTLPKKYRLNTKR